MTAAPITHSSVDCPLCIPDPPNAALPRPAPFAHRVAVSLLGSGGVSVGSSGGVSGR
jgi:hypothetical protein